MVLSWRPEAVGPARLSCRARPGGMAVAVTPVQPVVIGCRRVVWPDTTTGICRARRRLRSRRGLLWRGWGNLGREAWDKGVGIGGKVTVVAGTTGHGAVR